MGGLSHLTPEQLVVVTFDGEVVEGRSTLSARRTRTGSQVYAAIWFKAVASRWDFQRKDRYMDEIMAYEAIISSIYRSIFAGRSGFQ